MVELDGSHRVPAAGAERVRDVDPAERITVTVYVRRDPNAQPVPDPAAEAAKRPQDRRYLSPAEVAASFGASTSDLQAVVDYARSAGLSTSNVSAGTRSVRVTGPAGALGAAFGVELGYFQRGKVTYRGRVGAVKVPAPLAGIVEAVLGFDNRPVGRSYLRRSAPGATPAALGAKKAAGLPPNTYLPPQVTAGTRRAPDGTPVLDGARQALRRCSKRYAKWLETQSRPPRTRRAACCGSVLLT